MNLLTTTLRTLKVLNCGFFISSIISVFIALAIDSQSWATDNDLSDFLTTYQTTAQNDARFPFFSYKIAESYLLERPDILNVAPSPLPSSTNAKFTESRLRIEMTHLSIAAFLLEAYKGFDIYLLARDLEGLYDTLRLVAHDTTERSSIHIINISRLSSNSHTLPLYLDDVGLSDSHMHPKRNILIMDSGLRGTIIDAAKKRLSETNAHLVQGLLLYSETPRYKGMEIFSAMSGKNSAGALWSYETTTARFTHRVNYYVKFRGRYHPTSPLTPDSDADGNRNKVDALRLMQFTRYFWEHPTHQREFEERRRLIREMIGHIRNDAFDKIESTFENMKNHERKKFYEAAFSDLIKISRFFPTTEQLKKAIELKIQMFQSKYQSCRSIF